MKLRLSRQRTNYYCGPAVLQMVLRAAGVTRTQRQLATLAQTTKAHGTSMRALCRTLRFFGLRVREHTHRRVSDLRRALREGEVVIVRFEERHFGWDHYALVLRASGQRIVLLDPAEPRPRGVSIPLRQFKERWRNSGPYNWAAFVRAPAGRARSR